MTKKVLFTVLALGVLVSAGVGINLALADDEGYYPSIVTTLAEKFNLNESDVEAVFDAVHEERHEQFMQNRQENLNQAVEDGVITEEQKQALQDKWEEMHEHRLEHHEEMQAWFEEQGIDHDALMSYGWIGHMRFGGMHK